MILYNITTQVEHGIHAAWLKWMQQVYIPHLMDGGYFQAYHLSRVMGVDETEGITYSLLFNIANKTTFQLYQEKQAYEHQSMHDVRYGKQTLSFRSTMNVIDHGQ